MVRGPSIAVFAILVAAVSACARELSPAPDGPGYEAPAVPDAANAKEGREVGNRAPDFEATDIAGKSFKLSDYRGKVVVLDFWGFW